MNNNDKVKLFNQFYRIHNKFAIIKRKFVEESNDAHLYPSEMQVLCLVNTKSEITVTDVASYLHITKSAASQLVKKLNSKGMLRKYRSEVNERVVVLTTTDKGKVAVENFFNNESHAFGEMIKAFSSISDQELATISFFMDNLEKMFDKKLQ